MATKTGATATVIEHDGKLWKPKPGAMATAEEFVAARTLMVEIHRDGRWNPWVSDDRAAELEAAMDTFEQLHHVLGRHRAALSCIRKDNHRSPRTRRDSNAPKTSGRFTHLVSAFR